VRLKDGSEDFLVMSREEVDKVRSRSKAGNNGPWVTDFDEMGKKTAFRRHSKWLPLSTELREVIERDDDLTGADDRANEDAVDRLNASLRATSDEHSSPQPSLNPAQEVQAPTATPEPAPAASHGFATADAAIKAFQSIKVAKGHLVEKLDGKKPEQWDEADLAMLRGILDQIIAGEYQATDFFTSL